MFQGRGGQGCGQGTLPGEVGAWSRTRGSLQAGSEVGGPCMVRGGAGGVP